MTLVSEATLYVVTVKGAVVWPDATVTLLGTVAAAVLLLDRVTRAPPPGAGPVNVTVPLEITPPTTEVGFTVTLESAAGSGVTVGVWVIVGVRVNVGVIVGVFEIVGVCVIVGLPVIVGVCVIVKVRVNVGVIVGVFEIVGVCVIVRV